MILTKILAEELNKNMPSDRKSPDFSHITKLTKEGFEYILSNKILINFPSVTEINTDIFDLLFSYKNYYTVSFNGLNEITDDQADLFSKVNATISLNGLRNITKSSAEKLSKRQKSTSDSIFLNGIEHLDDEIFDELTKIKTPVYLDGLKSINVTNAKSLINNHNDLFSLNGLIDIDINIIEILVKFKGYLWLYGLKNLDVFKSNLFLKYQGRSLKINKTNNLYYNKAVILESYPDNSLKICVVKLKSTDGYTYLYAVGNSGGGTISEYICKYQQIGSIFNIYQSLEISEDPWGSYLENELTVGDKDLIMSIQDTHSISEILKYTKSEWLNYEDNFSLLPNAIKLLKKNFFASKTWEDEGSRMLGIISKNWNLNYRWN
jgi:hypothetical protein